MVRTFRYEVGATLFEGLPRPSYYTDILQCRIYENELQLGVQRHTYIFS